MLTDSSMLHYRHWSGAQPHKQGFGSRRVMLQYCHTRGAMLQWLLSVLLACLLHDQPPSAQADLGHAVLAHALLSYTAHTPVPALWCCTWPHLDSSIAHNHWLLFKP